MMRVPSICVNGSHQRSGADGSTAGRLLRLPGPPSAGSPLGPGMVAGMAYRVEIDQDECMSVGRCVADFPAGFGFDDDELATVLSTAGELSDQQLLRAARNCPSRAIMVFDADGNQVE